MRKLIYEYSKTDGGHESYLDPFQLPYTIPVDSGCWVATGAVLTPISPYWGNKAQNECTSIRPAVDYTQVNYHKLRMFGVYASIYTIRKSTQRVACGVLEFSGGCSWDANYDSKTQSK